MQKIGKIKPENNLILAPMLGVNCSAFRMQCKNHGAGLVSTPMIHPDSLTHQENKIDILKQEKPVIAQIVGKDPKKMSQAAAALEEYADIIDINMGCPDKAVLKNQSGAFLIKHPEQFVKMVSKVISSVNTPVTAKIRIGWDEKTINALKVAKSLEDLGINALAIHARTRKQVYSGKADWNIIKEVKEKINIPVIANGDIFNPQDYKRILEKTNADFAMIGRGAIGNPLIFENSLNYINHKKIIEKDLNKTIELFSEFLNFYEKYSLRKTFTEIRQHAMWFLKGVKKSASLKQKILKTKNIEEIKSILENSY